jgi:lysophospholipase L1-like esterase
MKNLKFFSALFILIIAGNFAVVAQENAPKPTQEQLDAWKKAEEERLRIDWANFARFRDDNIKIGVPAAGEKRVVFMGNSITEGWINIDPDFFAGKPYVNRGISGQTTPQMLVRFRPDVINLKPAVIVILAGINDIAGNTGPSTLEMIEDNLTSMVELAKANSISVVLSSVLPAIDFPWRPGMQPAEKVVQLNSWIKNYAEHNSCVYLDYFSKMADERNGLKSELTYDGVHPNLAGYKVMEPLVESAIQKALKDSSK